MAGMQIRLLEKTTYNMGSLAVAGAGAEIFFAQNVNVTRYREAMLLIRVHSKTMPTSTKVTFKVYKSSPSAEDPSVVFRDTTSIISTTEHLAADTVPELLNAVIPTSGSGFGSTLDFSLTPTYVAGGGTFQVSYSIDLVVKV